MYHITNYEFGWLGSIPYIGIDIECSEDLKGISDPYLLNVELNSLNYDYLCEIEKLLEKIKNNEINEYEFWFDCTGILSYSKKSSIHPWQTFIIYDDNEKQVEIYFDEIFQVMKNGRNMLKNGKIKLEKSKNIRLTKTNEQ